MAKKAKFEDYLKNSKICRENRKEVITNSEFEHHSVYVVPPEVEKAITKAENKKIKASSNPIKKDIVSVKKEDTSHLTQALNEAKPTISLQNQSPKSISVEILSDENEIRKRILNLEGLQQRIFYGLLQKASLNDSHLIQGLSYDQLITISQGSYGSTKTSLKRLINKGLIIRHKGKTSIGGYYNLGFNPLVYELSLNFALKSRAKEPSYEYAEA